MRKSLFTLLLACTTFFSFSQSATLTKGETIAYLNKKINEAVGHKLSNNNGFIGDIYNAEVKVDTKGITIRYCWINTSGLYYWSSYVFNPSHIQDILPYANTSESAINELKISLVGKTCVFTSGTGYYSPTTQSGSVAYANFLQLRADPENLNKIKKALLYLKSLLKAEDDPFGS